MLRKALLSITVALFTLIVLIIGVTAQSDEEPDDQAVIVQPDAAAANVVQTVPVTLTLTIPGASGPVQVEVPVFLSLDIRIGISPSLTTSLLVTPSVVTEVTVVTDDEVEATATTESVAAVPTRTSTPTPTTPAPTATAPPDDAEPTETESTDAEAAEAEVTEESPLPTATATVAPAAVVAAPACPDPLAVITAPGNGQVVSGTVEMIGTATHPNFQYYKVEYAQGANIDPNNSFSYLADARVQIIGSLLTAFDSTGFVNGPYTLKLTVVDNSGNFPPPCTVSVDIQN